MRLDFRRLDVYRKISTDLTEPTYTGATISVICTSIILLLLIFELSSFISPEIINELYVENSEERDYIDKMSVRLNISLVNLDCKYIGLDIQDDNGRHEVGFLNNTKKRPINDDKGCNFECSFYINKVPGNFHISTHSAKEQPGEIDMKHTIHSLEFGEDLTKYYVKGSFNSLKDTKKFDSHELETHEYHIKVVPTIYEYNDLRIESFQYAYGYKSYFSFTLGSRIIPAIWFKYDLNPITVKYSKARKPLYSFLTTICAVIGGVFTVAGIIDSIIFTASNTFKKFELGKLS